MKDFHNRDIILIFSYNFKGFMKKYSDFPQFFLVSRGGLHENPLDVFAASPEKIADSH